MGVPGFKKGVSCDRVFRISATLTNVQEVRDLMAHDTLQEPDEVELWYHDERELRMMPCKSESSSKQ